MKAEDFWTSNLLDGSLYDSHANALVICMRQDPAFAKRVSDELATADLLSRELNPTRTDAAFLVGLDRLLEGGLGLDLDDWETVPEDALAAEPTSQQSPPAKTFTKPASTPPSAPLAPAKANLGPIKALTVIGTVAGVLIGGTFHLTKKAPAAETTSLAQPELPPPTAAPAPPTPTVIELFAEADAGFHSGDNRKKAFGKNNSFTLHTNGRKSSCGSLMRFDLTQIPEDFTSATLYLYPIAADGKQQPIAVRLVKNNSWPHAEVTHDSAPKASGKPHAKWQPQTDEWNKVDLTGLIRSRSSEAAQVSLLLQIPGKFGDKEYASITFASSEHENADQRPVLRIETVP